MMYVLVWMQLFSTQTVEHYQLGSYATIEECQIELSKAAKMVTVSFYWIMAILIILAWCNFGADTETGSQYNGEVYAPTNIGEK